MVVTDQHVAVSHPDLIANREAIILEPGEQSKSMKTYEALCRKLVERGTTRKSTLIALGGGVIGDLVGFVAATYMRGINYIQIPTTLLSQVDSSVGGKTGIDLPEGKNLVGAFYPPSVVQIDTSLLATLPERQFQCGMAEVIKTGFIQSPYFVETLQSKPLSLGDQRLKDVVEECVAIKARIVQEDEFETLGLRAQLNFGHTIGHALEKITHYCKYTHGEAIAVGMVVESRIAEEIGFAERGLADMVESLLKTHGLPTNAVELKEIDHIILAMRADKKSLSGEISMSLVKGAGTCSLVPKVDEAIVRETLDEFAKS